MKPAFTAGSVLLGMAAGLCSGQVDVLTQHNDPQRTGANLAEKVLNTSTVNPQHFGKLWTLYADGQIVAQPLYVSNLKTPRCPSPDGCNAVIFCTLHNTVYVYDADRKPTTRNDTLLWARWLGQPRKSSRDIDMWHTNDPEWGILSTPVIDRKQGALYVVSWNDAGNQAYRYYLHAFELATGDEKLPAEEISGSLRITKPKPQTIVFHPELQKQRPALLLQNGIIYIAFGASNEAQHKFHGWLFAYEAHSLKQEGIWCSTPAGRNGGIWQSGQGPAADAEGNIYLTIGDGTFAARDSDYGDSFVKLRLENSQLTVKDYFTPCNQAYLAKNDLDFGSSGPISIPGTSFLLGAGKQGRLYLLDSQWMGKYVASPGPRESNCVNPNARDEVQVTAGGHLHGSPVFWQSPDAPRVYVWGEMDALKSYVVRQGKLQTPPAKSNYVIGCDRPREMCMPGGMLSISSDESKPGTGIVWAVVPSNGDASKRRGVAGMVVALDAENVSRELWRSERPGGRDQLGMFAKFCPPTVAGGKVFVATYGDRSGDPAQNYADVRYYLAVYGILP